MTSSGWRTGDLGRSTAARNDRPQFETLSASKAGVVVWHHMWGQPATIPLKTFKVDYTPTWVLARAVPQHAVSPGQIYTMRKDIWHQPEYRAYERQLDGVEFVVDKEAVQFVSGRSLKVRRVQHNYVSCDVVDGGVLVILPVEWLSTWGVVYTSLWEQLESDWSL